MAAGNSETRDMFTRYRETRNLAIKFLDPKPLSTVESGPVLDIDSGSFEVSQRLAERQKIDNARIDVFNVKSPLVTKYPLWFMAQVRDAGTYAEALNNPSGTATGKVENDGFIKRMRGIADTKKLLKNVRFSQTRGANDVDFAAITQDGGALVFATLLRLDT